MQQSQIIEEEVDISLRKLTHVGMQHLGIIGHNRTVIAVFRAVFVYVIGHAGIEDIRNALL